MRKTTRILAIVLLALMLVGMIPFSLFAEEGTDAPATDGTTEKTYAEQVADYVAENGGILYYAQDYEGEGVDVANNRVQSLVGGKHSMALTPKDGDVFTNEDGALKVIKGTKDGFTQVNFNQKDTVGKDMVIEVSVKGENLPNGAGIIFTQEYLRKADGSDEISAYRLITTLDGNYITNFSKKPLAAISADEYVTFKVVVKYSLNMAYFFVNDQFVCTDQLIDGTYDYSRAKSGYDVAAFR